MTGGRPTRTIRQASRALNTCLTVLAGAVCCGLSATPAEGAAPARIVSVERRFEQSAGRTLGGAQLTKFMDEFEPALGEVFRVRWKAPPDGLPAGVAMIFEYRQERSNRVKALNTQFASRMRGECVVPFTVPAETLRAAGPVTAWRVRLVYRGKLLASEQAGAWR